ncbi:hypothetical protein ACFZ8E_19050 [Methylobacterium sp. HMF5984]|uniref:hypothetical protein n=1 Tax=Methylobacterium sp. HMF5984 TaxID=3367370 RepID=UPI003853CE81
MAPNRFALLAAGDDFTITQSWIVGAAARETRDGLVGDLDMALHTLATRFPRCTLTADQVRRLRAHLGAVLARALRLLPPAIDNHDLVTGFRAAADLVGMWSYPLECRATSLLTAEAMAAVRAFQEKLSAMRRRSAAAQLPQGPSRPPTLRMHPAKDCKVIPFPKPYLEPAR